MSDEDERIALENFLLLDDKDLAIESFPPTSSFKRYLKANKLLKSGQFKSNEFKGELKELQKLNLNYHNTLKLRELIKSLEFATNSSEKSKIIQKLNNKYFHYKFNYETPEIGQKAKNSEFRSFLNEKLFENDLSQAHCEEKIYNQLEIDGKKCLNAAQMKTKIFQTFAKEMPNLHEISGVSEKLSKILESSENYESYWFTKMSLSQLNKLMELQKKVALDINFVLHYFEKKYLYKLYNSDDNWNKLEILKKLWFEIRDYPDEITPLKSAILINILRLNLDFGIYDEGLFIQYLNIHRSNSIYKNKPKWGDNESFYTHMNRVIKEEKVIKRHLEEILKIKEDCKEFEKFFKKDFIKKQFAIAKILSGQSFANYSEDLSQAEINEISELVELEPSKENSASFNRNQLVKISLVTKNISKLLVKILEINTKSYYLEQNIEINENIELHGLMAKHEIIYEFNESPLMRIKRKFEFPELTDLSGVFVIEFIGNGRCCRTIIKKGFLKYISKITDAGYLFMVLDENNQICKNPGSGVTVDGRFYSAENEKGQAFVPYANCKSEKKIIICDGTINQLIEKFEHLDENYTLKAAIFANQEQFISKKKATISIKPRLYINDVKALNSLLTNLKATISTIDLDNFTSTSVYENLSIPKKNSLINLDFIVPENLKKLCVSISGEVESIINKNKIPLEEKYEMDIKETWGTQCIYGAYLRYGIKGYQIEIRGRSGEILPWQKIELALSHRYWIEMKKETLIADEEGNIYLGDLKNIYKVIASININEESQYFSWNINSFTCKINYPQKIDLCQGDEFGLPFDENWIKDSNIIWVSLTEKNESIIIDDLKSNIVIDYEHLMVWLKNLSIGKFTLRIYIYEIEIEVHDGIHFLDNQFILTDHYAIKTPKQYRTLSIGPCEITRDQLKINLLGDSQNSNIYAFFSNYLFNDDANIFESLSSLLSETGKTLNYSENKSIYTKSEFLDEEYRYIIDRKYQAKNIGIGLKKPQLLLKRLMRNKTYTEIQTAKQGDKPFLTKGGSKGLGRVGAYKKCRRDIARSRENDDESEENVEVNYTEKPAIDFLKYAAEWVFSSTSDKGTVFIPLTDYKYTHILLIATNGENICMNVITNPHAFVQIKSLQYQSGLDLTQYYSEQIQCKSAYPGEIITINNFSNYQIISSISKLYQLQRELIKMSNNNINYEEWNFLDKWQSLNLSTKLDIYDKFISHELNLFLYKKDKKFFDDIVAPLLSCKMEKDFIDKYLLSESLDEYLDIHKFTNLNALEKVLLIERSVEKNSMFAEELAKLLKNETDSFPVDYNMRKQRIELVLRLDSNKADKVMSPTSPMGSPDEGEDQECEESEDEQEFRGMMDTMRDIPVYFKNPEEVKEFCETFYYGIKNSNKNKELVKNSPFWSNLAFSILTKKSYILTEDVLATTQSLTELIGTLAFADLPLIESQIETITPNNSVSFKSNSNFLIFYKEIMPTPSELYDQILMRHKYFDPADRYIQSEFGKRDKIVTTFIKQKLYGCQVIITNTTGWEINVDLFTEIPQGSIPIKPSKHYTSEIFNIENFYTKTYEYLFYFPYSGEFTHYPGSVSYKDKVIAKCEPSNLIVDEKVTISQFTSFKDLALTGQKDMILEFLRTENLFLKTKEFNVKDFCWMLKDEVFWRKSIEILKQRNYYFDEIWSFGIFHHDIAIIHELLTMNKKIQNELGRFFNSSIITTGKGDYLHLEYDPIINARAHKLGKNPRIANVEFKNSYKSFLEFLCEKENLDVSDQLCFVQYLTYQDRISEAREVFGKIPLHPSTEKPGSSHLQIQYDYFCCYFDPEMLPIISVLYENYPIESWRKLFNDAAKFSREIQNQDLSMLDSKEKEPTLMFSIEKDCISLQYQWVSSCKIRFYRVDLEVLFSKNPFFIGNSQHFKYVKPYLDMEINLIDDGQTKIKIPELLIGQNIIIEVDYGVYTISKSHFSANLKVNLIERYGIAKIMNENLTPRAGAYIKVFVRQKNGDIKFYKDGYTDTRGKFDYVSLNVNELLKAEKFAILVVDEELGSLVLEASPPPQ